jgi:hypothetical protein
MQAKNPQKPREIIHIMPLNWQGKTLCGLWQKPESAFELSKTGQWRYDIVG